MPLIEYLKTIDTPTLANAIELLKLRPRQEGFTPLSIRALFPHLGRMCGYAVTAQVETVTQSEPFDISHFIELYRLVESSPKPAVIALQEIGGQRDYAAHAGEVMSTFFKRLGAVGLVSDCGVRDLDEVEAMGFHYFARGSVASHANFHIVRSGIPVQIEGMVVKPGDLLHGDRNGLITVPSTDESAIKTAVGQIRSREGKILDFVRSDKFSLAGFRDMVVE